MTVHNPAEEVYCTLDQEQGQLQAATFVAAPTPAEAVGHSEVVVGKSVQAARHIAKEVQLDAAEVGT